MFPKKEGGNLDCSRAKWSDAENQYVRHLFCADLKTEAKTWRHAPSPTGRLNLGRNLIVRRCASLDRKGYHVQHPVSPTTAVKTLLHDSPIIAA